MKPDAEYRKLIETKGISLQSPGLTEFALGRDDAILAVDLLRSASIPILGGDVYFKKPTGIELAYANWYSEPVAGESRDRFVIRSCLETRNCIENFPSAEATPIFVFVIGL